MKLCITLDDFGMKFMTEKEWTILEELKYDYPPLKISMFTIPEHTTPNYIEYIHKDYPWIEILVHGTDHLRGHCQLPTRCPEGFKKIYRAPWWNITEKEMKELQSIGYKVSTNKTNKFKGDFVYDEGQELIKDIHYKLPNGLYTWHGHVQSQRKANKLNPNGLPDVIELFKKTIPKNTEFVWLSGVLDDKY